MIAIDIAPHERSEAIEAYKDRLTVEQIEQIKNAPETAPILIMFRFGGDWNHTVVQVGRS